MKNTPGYGDLYFVATTWGGHMTTVTTDSIWGYLTTDLSEGLAMTLEEAEDTIKKMNEEERAKGEDQNDYVLIQIKEVMQMIYVVRRTVKHTLVARIEWRDKTLNLLTGEFRNLEEAQAHLKKLKADLLAWHHEQMVELSRLNFEL